MSVTSVGPTTARTGGLSLQTIAAAATIGQLIEAYDFIIYSFVAALVFGPLFFPTVAPWTGTLFAIASQAVAYVARPLGAVIFGRLGDKAGRRIGLLVTLSLMGLSTFLIGLLPGYATIGATAPVLLVTLRVIQGVAYGGEWGGAILIAVEHAPQKRKTLFGAIPQLGTALSFGLATATLLMIGKIVSRDAFTAWGWRVPFLVGAALIVVGIVVRAKVEETPEFKAALEKFERGAEPRANLGVTLRESSKSILAMVLNVQASAIAIPAFATGLLAFVPRHVHGLKAADVQIGMIIGAVVMALVTIWAARLGERIGKERVLLINGVFAIVAAFPAYALVASGSAVLLWIGISIGLATVGFNLGVIGATMSEHFPVRLRYFGLCFAFAMASVVGGALLPIPALAWAEKLGGSTLPLALAFLLGGVLTTIGALWTSRLPKYEAPQ